MTALNMPCLFLYHYEEIIVIDMLATILMCTTFALPPARVVFGIFVLQLALNYNLS